METGRSVEILDPYDWLPAYGETAVELCLRHGDLIVRIEYDETDGGEPRAKEMIFRSVCAVHESSVPGVNLLDLGYSVEDATPLTSLVEYPDSEAALAWTTHFGNSRACRHYRIYFMAENLKIEVFAQEIVLHERD